VENRVGCIDKRIIEKGRKIKGEGKCKRDKGRRGERDTASFPLTPAPYP
jgi:hypothetical protein